MPSIGDNLKLINDELPAQTKLVAVSKTYPVETIMQAYNEGQRIFGENKVQEMCEKQAVMPADVEWHLIGHLQTNKVKYIAPFVSLIHSVDSLKLLQEINKQAAKHKRVIDCLLQIYIATEETKFGLGVDECEQLLSSNALDELKNVRVVGLMGMASNTRDKNKIREEFKVLKRLKDKFSFLKEMSCGMSSDYHIAIEEGSTLVRIGSSIFGHRNYNN